MSDPSCVSTSEPFFIRNGIQIDFFHFLFFRSDIRTDVKDGESLCEMNKHPWLSDVSWEGSGLFYMDYNRLHPDNLKLLVRLP